MVCHCAASSRVGEVDQVQLLNVLRRWGQLGGAAQARDQQE
jgi:hypothetical protein